MNNNNKTQIEMNFSYILMLIIFVIMLIFGIIKINNIKNTLTEQEINDYKIEFNNIIKYCNEPINKKNSKSFTIENNKINMVCIIGNDFETNLITKDNPEIISLVETNNRVFFAKTLNVEFDEDPNIRKISDYKIIKSIKLDGYNGKTNCFLNEKNKIEIKITCS